MTDFKYMSQETEKQRKNVGTNFHALNGTKSILVSLFAGEEAILVITPNFDLSVSSRVTTLVFENAW